MSCSKTQHSGAGEARTLGPSVSSRALYHCDPMKLCVSELNYSVGKACANKIVPGTICLPFAADYSLITAMEYQLEGSGLEI